MVSIAKQQVVQVTLPRRSSRAQFFELLSVVLDPDMNVNCRRIHFDFSLVADWGIGAIATMSNLIEILRKADVKISYGGFQTCPAGAFLEQTGFYQRYLDNDEAFRRGATRHMLPLELVDYERSHAYIENRLKPWLESALDWEEGQGASIEVCMKEIFNNIVDHSMVDVGCAIACADPKRRLIDICATDLGVGIPANVKKKIGDVGDGRAIEMACAQGFTTRSVPGNRGEGLHTLLRNVVDLNRGEVLLFSGRGYVIKSRLKGNETLSVGTNKIGYPGTLISITLDPKSVARPQVEEAFEW
ncbi:ATP-binding protein [Pigmentiphaga kullae]|uniref:Histidine kinase/DNA gyrase B/HSP90-like ATPase n=1 Tax=Pigmentiphaga kullae TaxID=151784 RepID=A0A4V2F2Z6_9BURK|nr:ATP-binding protein [Pigmentiphaga kullae]RZS80624.1 hypothetical protein EV675_3236 [Pigmentiphaga kullae]